MLALFVGLSLAFAQFYDTSIAALDSEEERPTRQQGVIDDALELTVAFTSGSYTGARGSRTVDATVTAAPAPDRKLQ